MPIIYFSAVLGGILLQDTINNVIQLIVCSDDKRSTEIEEVQIVAVWQARRRGKTNESIGSYPVLVYCSSCLHSDVPVG